MEDISIGRKRHVKEGKPEGHYEKETSCWHHPVGEEEKTIGKGRYHQIWPQDRELKPSKEIVHWTRNIKPRIKIR